MATATTYFSKEDLEDALSIAIVKLAYDDDHNGVADERPLAACFTYAMAECNSFLRRVITSGGSRISLPYDEDAIPDEVKFAALDFGIAYTARRRPDAMKAVGDLPWTTYYDYAVAKMKRYCESLQIIPEASGTHATEGAAIQNPDSDEDGAEEDLPDESTWSDLGDFC